MFETQNIKLSLCFIVYYLMRHQSICLSVIIIKVPHHNPLKGNGSRQLKQQKNEKNDWLLVVNIKSGEGQMKVRNLRKECYPSSVWTGKRNTEMNFLNLGNRGWQPYLNIKDEKCLSYRTGHLNVLRVQGSIFSVRNLREHSWNGPLGCRLLFLETRLTSVAARQHRKKCRQALRALITRKIPSS